MSRKLSDPRQLRWFTVRRKLLGAFTLLAVVGGSGGIVSFFSLHDLSRAYQHSQAQVAAHEAVHEDRIVLLSLLDLATRYQTEREPGLRNLIDTRVLQLDASTQRCNECHRLGYRPIDLATAQVKDLQRSLAWFLQTASSEAPADRAGSLQAFAASVHAMEESRGRMEARFHTLLERQRESSSTIFLRALRQQLALVAGGVVLALLLAWAMARVMGRSVLPLIAAAHRMGNGSTSHSAANLPHDPALVQVAGALNEMATSAAKQAREDARRQLLDRTIASQEEERKRIARELHDELGQSLSALLMAIRSQNSRGGPVPPDVGKALEAKVSRMLDEVHRMAWDLRPSLLDDLGLHSALGRYAENMSKRYGMPVDYQAVGFEEGHKRLPGLIETVLYRIAQEALNNVARHAGAHRASVVLIRRGQEAALLVEDDGSGFDVEVVRQDRASLGILGMEERVALAGGTLTIVSQLGKGTSVRAVIPVNGTHV